MDHLWTTLRDDASSPYLTDSPVLGRRMRTSENLSSRHFGEYALTGCAAFLRVASWRREPRRERQQRGEVVCLRCDATPWSSSSCWPTCSRGGLGAHRPKRVRELIEERGCELSYLPPYSPDLNPIEEALSKIKHPQEDRRPHQGVPDRGDGPSTGSRERPGCTGVLRPLRLPHPGAATMKGADGRGVDCPKCLALPS